MIIKNIKNDKCTVFVDEQLLGNKRYIVSSAYAPTVGIETEQIRISVSNIDDSKEGIQYEEIHAVDFIDGEVKCIIYFDDRNRSSGGFRKPDDQEELFNEVIGSFDELISSDISDLSDEAIEIISRVKRSNKKL